LGFFSEIGVLDANADGFSDLIIALENGTVLYYTVFTLSFYFSILFFLYSFF